MKVRRLAKLVDHLERRRLLALDPHRVDAVHDLHLAGLTQLADDPQRIVEVALDRNRRRAVHQRLRQFAQRDIAVRQQHDALDPGAGRVGRRRGGRVAGARANDHLRTPFHRLGHRHGHAAVLERSGRVQPLVLQVQLDVAANLAGQAVGTNQRRVALEQRHDRRRVVHRQILRVATDHSLPRAC